MATENFKRKLTAILSADAVGYSRLMGGDEADTVKTLETYKGVMFSLIKQHRGRVVDSPGDNLLAEFGSVVDAVQCAVSIQKELQARNADLAENRRMAFRIGINLGDVIEEQDRIYGDGVNIAARLEALADPGGICVSKTAFDHIESKLPLGYEFLGEQAVKNIAKPVGAYKVLMETRVVGVKTNRKSKATPFWRKTAFFPFAIIATIAIVAGLVWMFYPRGTSIEAASVERMAYPLPDKPSIAVLPFANMSGDPEQEYIGDGLSENIISALSVSSKMFVMSRSATFTYKEKPVKPQQVAEDLGVQYVLEGSIVKSGDRLRVTAQLIDALAGHHLWAEVYDREMRGLFELQDEITKKIVVSIGVELGGGEGVRVFSKSTDNLEAWKSFTKGYQHYFKFTLEDNKKAREYYTAALDLDTEYVAAMSMLAATHLVDVIIGWSDSPLTSMNRAFELAQKAVELDEQDPFAHAILGMFFLYQREYEKAITEGKRSITLNPNFPNGHVLFAYIMHFSGRFDEAISLAKKAYRLDPNLRGVLLPTLTRSYIFLESYEEALETIRKMEEHALTGSREEALSKIYFSWVYQELGTEEKARTYIAEALKIAPDWSIENVINDPYKDPAHLKRVLETLRKAGMPEYPPGAVQEKPSIAVLPFKNLSSDKEQEYFSDGLSEELINKLSQVKDLQVTARTSSFYFKDKNEDMRTIAEKLGVIYLLEGSVRKAGDQLRVTAQLIKAEDGYHLWSKTYDREMKDIFIIQDDIAKAVTTALSVSLGIGEFNRPGMTRNVEAFDEHLQANAELKKRTPDSMLAAIDHAEHAVHIDPAFGLGWIDLRDAYILSIDQLPTWQIVNFNKKADEALEHAKDVAPDMPELLRITAEKKFNAGNWLEADHIYRQLIDMDGSTNARPNQDFCWPLVKAGKITEALPFIQRAKRLDPLGATNSWLLVLALFDLSRLDAALAENGRGKTLEGIDFAFALFDWLTALMRGDKSAASTTITGYYNLEGEYPSVAMLQIARCLTSGDDKALLAEIKTILNDSGATLFDKTNLVHFAALSGDPKLALECFRRSGSKTYEALWGPHLKDMRRLPGFKDLVREIGLVDYWRKSGNWNDFCHPYGDDDFMCE